MLPRAGRRGCPDGRPPAGAPGRGDHGAHRRAALRVAAAEDLEVILEARAISAPLPAPRSRCALDQVSCQVNGSELVAVVGPNGSGKTTLVRALLGLVPLESGAVLVDGRPVGSMVPPRAGSDGGRCRAAGRSGLSPPGRRDRDAGPLRSPGSPRRARPRRSTRRSAPRWSGAISSAWRSARSTRSPAASGSGCGSPAPWPRSRARSCSTSRRHRSTSAMRWSCWSWCDSWSTGALPAWSSPTTSISPLASPTGSCCWTGAPS